jgi:hypothetical protein
LLLTTVSGGIHILNFHFSIYIPSILFPKAYMAIKSAISKVESHLR